MVREHSPQVGSVNKGPWRKIRNLFAAIFRALSRHQYASHYSFDRTMTRDLLRNFKVISCTQCLCFSKEWLKIKQGVSRLLIQELNVFEDVPQSKPNDWYVKK